MTIDCVVVGGGIIGMMTARELSIAGLKVQILEKGTVGREASWAGGGILSPLTPWNAPEEIWPMVAASQIQYPILCAELLEETGIDSQYIRSGMLNLDSTEGEKLTYWQNETGSCFEILDKKQISEREPLVDERIGSAILLPDVAQVRPPRLLKALKKSLQKRGVIISENVEVTDICRTQYKVDAVQTSQGRIDCESVVIAAGAWSGRFLKDKTAIKPVKGQMLRIEVPECFLSSITLKGDVYLIPRKADHQNSSPGKHQVLIGSTIENVGFDQSTTEEAAKKLYAAGIKILPILEKYSISQQWSGLRPGSEHGIPTIDKVDGVEGLYINSGHHRNGVTLAPSTSNVIQDMVVNSL